MTDEELLLFNDSGFIPGPTESEQDFKKRVESTRQAFLKLGETSIPSVHWEWVANKLRDQFGFTPLSLPAFYSNRSLTPWQGAAAWVERGQVLAIQLREAFRKGTFLGIYQRGEILAHEAVHAARSAFPADCWDEFFAYMTSEISWRRVLGPIIQRPWEVWPLLVLCVFGAFFPPLFWGVTLWSALGFYRLIRSHLILRKAGLFLKKLGLTNQGARCVLLRLTNSEILSLSNGINIFMGIPPDVENLRLRLILLVLKKYKQ